MSVTYYELICDIDTYSLHIGDESLFPFESDPESIGAEKKDVEIEFVCNYCRCRSYPIAHCYKFGDTYYISKYEIERIRGY